MPEGMVNKPSQSILYYLKNASTVTIDIVNDKEEIIKSWSQDSHSGVNSTSWEYGEIVRGKYKVIFKTQSAEDELSFEIK